MNTSYGFNTESLLTDVASIRTTSPLVHNITNYVVMNNTANALLAIGASPVMAHAIEEVEEMVKLASAFVINIGTLSKDWIEAMILAGEAAHKKGVPVVLDPVGAGATKFRTYTCKNIIERCHPSIIRGNASEIMALCTAAVNTKGVDSTMNSSDAVEAAKILAKSTAAVVVISGPVDYITDGEYVVEIPFGSKMMTCVTGLGCTASAIIGAFAGVNADYLQASVNAMAVMGIAGQLAAQYSKGSGSLQINFLDELYNFGHKSVEKIGKP